MYEHEYFWRSLDSRNLWGFGQATPFPFNRGVALLGVLAVAVVVATKLSLQQRQRLQRPPRQRRRLRRLLQHLLLLLLLTTTSTSNTSSTLKQAFRCRVVSFSDSPSSSKMGPNIEAPKKPPGRTQDAPKRVPKNNPKRVARRKFTQL